MSAHTATFYERIERVPACGCSVVNHLLAGCTGHHEHFRQLMAAGCVCCGARANEACGGESTQHHLRVGLFCRARWANVRPAPQQRGLFGPAAIEAREDLAAARAEQQMQDRELGDGEQGGRFDPWV